jgi:Terminase RNaseH-like domain
MFSLPAFYRFCNSLRIDTKESGAIILGKSFMKSQRRLINEIGSGLENGVHEFVTLKARQLGISTASLAIDLYWAGKYRGVSGALITHDEPSREQFRTTLQMYYQSLPMSLKRKILQHNRNQIVFQHGTRFQYKVAGTKTKASGTLGRSAALSFLHATEVAYWGNEADINSLVATLARNNPTRFYHWETTANGFNHFYHMWMGAKDSVTRKTIFIGWWANNFYRAEVDSDIYKSYWGVNGKMTPDERTMVKEVKDLYGVSICAEQLAWYRWYYREECNDDEMMMWQEMPHTEYAAFVSTGSHFFQARTIGDAYRAAIGNDKPQCFKFNFGLEFQDTEISVVDSKIATLKIWERSVPGAEYVMGADPAYGSSATADRYAIVVWRCYSNKLVQVAEFCQTQMSTANFAWAMVYLAAYYEPCTWNLEINGPGQAVLTEINNMVKSRTLGPEHLREPMSKAMSRIRTYLYRRFDAIYSAPSAIHTISTEREKERFLGAFKDYFERGYLTIRSPELVDEMKNLERVDGGAPNANSRSKDDRAIAAALGIIAWNDQIRSRLMTDGKSWEASQENGGKPIQNTVGGRMVQRMMQDIGFTKLVKPEVHQGTGSHVPRQ